ncbi:MAG: zinc ribbon domain-containing protein [Rubrivivax sp.]
MPIYAYRCTTCGHAKDVLQKVSDPLLTECPACGAGTFVKQVTAAGFQLKGSGWYVTDFRGGSNNAGGKADGDGGTDKGSGEKAAEKAGEKASVGGDKGQAATTSPAPAPAPASSASSASAAPAASKAPAPAASASAPAAASPSPTSSSSGR